MKNLITKFLALSSLALLMLPSCKKDGAIVTVDPSTTTAATLTSSSTAPALVKANLKTTAVTFTTTAPKYSYNAAYTNTLQVAVKGTNFTSPKEVPFDVNVFTQSYTVQDFNNILLALNLPSGASAQVEVRVKSSLSTTAGIVYSNVVTITATPFALVSYLYVPGAYQSTVVAQQWIPATADSLQSPTGNGVYTGIINFTGTGSALQFKITPVKTWDNSYGLDASGNFKLNPTTQYAPTGGNLTAPAAGQYLVTVDLNVGTITFTTVDYYSAIGDATANGWGTDTDLKFNNGTRIWTLTTSLVSTGAFKFRKNHDWGTSYGWPTTSPSNTLTSTSGNNMSVTTSGTYAITFSVSTTDATVATYTAVKQ
jgi:hypothetical protein